MKRLIGLVLVLSLPVLGAGCNKPPEPSGTAQAAPPLILGKGTAPASNQPRLLQLKLTLDQPSDLKVKTGAMITAGHLLSDRASKREQLVSQKQRLLIQLDKLTSTPAQPVQPQPSYATEAAQIHKAEAEVKQAKAAIAKQEASSPWTQTAVKELGIQDKEQVKLQSQLTKAQADQTLAVAKLQAAAAKHQQADYKEAVAVSAKQPDTSAQQALLLTQLNEVEQKLTELGTVRSPYGGTIKHIKWLGQRDQQLEVELLIAVAPEGT